MSNLEAAVDNLATGESAVYLAQHPANELYYISDQLSFSEPSSRR